MKYGMAKIFVHMFADSFLAGAVSENETPANGSKRRRVAAPPTSPLGKEKLPVADGKKQYSSPRLESTTQEYLPDLAKKHRSNLHENADLWDGDTLKARKAAVELNKAFTSHVDLSRFDKVDSIEVSEMLMLHAARMAAGVQSLQKKCSQDAALAAESHAKIIKLTQDLEDAQSKVKLEKIYQETAKILVEQTKQEKHIVELEFKREKACLKRKIEELETELQRQKDRFKYAVLDAENDGYNKCVKKTKEKGLRYTRLLLDPLYDLTGNQLVHPSDENSRDLDNDSDSTPTVPIDTDSTPTVPTVKALVDPADPTFYRSVIKLLAIKHLDGGAGSVVNKMGESGTLKPTSSFLNISENYYKQLKDDKTELARMKKAAFILGYKKCAEFVGEGNVCDPSKHNFKAFLASEVARLGILVPSSGKINTNEANKFRC